MCFSGTYLGNSTNAQSCFNDMVEYSEPCAQCFGDAIQCMKESCGTPCSSDAGGIPSSACATCTKENCMPAFENCSGLTPPLAPPDSLALDACADSADRAIWNSTDRKDFNDQLNVCLYVSRDPATGNRTLEQECMHGLWGYSDGCAHCFGDTFECTRKNCWANCTEGGAGGRVYPDCISCLYDHCAIGLQICSGLAPPFSAAPQRRLMIV